MKLFNKSLFMGNFLNEWKLVSIATILKNGARDDRPNYKLISDLPCISRLSEKLIFNQFHEYLDTNKSLYEHQSGFQVLHLVATDHMANRNDWYWHIDKVNYIGPNFVDLKMAFYLVDHKILLKN